MSSRDVPTDTQLIHQIPVAAPNAGPGGEATVLPSSPVPAAQPRAHAPVDQRWGNRDSALAPHSSRRPWECYCPCFLQTGKLRLKETDRAPTAPRSTAQLQPRPFSPDQHFPGVRYGTPVSESSQKAPRNSAADASDCGEPATPHFPDPEFLFCLRPTRSVEPVTMLGVEQGGAAGHCRQRALPQAVLRTLTQ